jgi:predicted RNase H-like nuclease (RuvC/YqgF family)
VAKVNPALVSYDGHGKIYTVHYQTVDAMLLNEFLKQHQKVSKLEASNSKLEATTAKLEASNSMLEATLTAQAKAATEQQEEIKSLTASLKEQASLLQKVSLQIEVNRPAPQVAANK